LDKSEENTPQTAKQVVKAMISHELTSIGQISTGYVLKLKREAHSYQLP
jgi:hypothetical protein